MNKKRVFRWTFGFIFLLLLAVIFFILNLANGSSNLSISEILEVFKNVIYKRNVTDSAYRIIFDIRMPRTVSAMILGGALSVSGFLLQSFFGNPIAGPFVLGISSGAKLVVAFAMIISLKSGIMLSSGVLIISAFMGSLLSMGTIVLISGKIKNMAQLIISGVMIGYICSAITDLAVAFADDANIVSLHNWSMGSFSGIDRSDIKIMTVIVLTTLVATFMISKPMGAYQLGEAYAENMGVNIRLFRLMLVLLSSILSACATAFAGPISFVGVAVPHLMKNLFGTAKPIIIIPAAFIGGGVFCMMCDLLARMLFAPLELSVSTVTAIFGAPVIILIMLRRERERRYKQ